MTRRLLGIASIKLQYVHRVPCGWDWNGWSLTREISQLQLTDECEETGRNLNQFIVDWRVSPNSKYKDSMYSCKKRPK